MSILLVMSEQICLACIQDTLAHRLRTVTRALMNGPFPSSSAYQRNQVLSGTARCIADEVTNAVTFPALLTGGRQQQP